MANAINDHLCGYDWYRVTNVAVGSNGWHAGIASGLFCLLDFSCGGLYDLDAIAKRLLCAQIWLAVNWCELSKKWVLDEPTFYVFKDLNL